jgi:diaminopimelate epimerase
MIFSKYHGAGNDFLIADNRDGSYRLSTKKIVSLCDRHTGIGADGIILLRKSKTKDSAFEMAFYNPDGSHGMMCGNGGRCIVAFAAFHGIIPKDEWISFSAPDGIHKAICFSPVKKLKDSSSVVRLSMNPVSEITEYADGIFLNTGARHFVKFVEGPLKYPVDKEGPALRNDHRFAPEGTNVDFVGFVPILSSDKEPGYRNSIEYPAADPNLVKKMQSHSFNNSIAVRTFEKGVEAETLACGTGLVASAIASYAKNFYIPKPNFCIDPYAKYDLYYEGQNMNEDHFYYQLKTEISDIYVDFVPHGSGKDLTADEIFLTGPAAFVAQIEV